jgi:crotonobetaine/carnitine-CoA ligase
MPNPQAPGVVGPFAGLDAPWPLRMRDGSRRDHPFLIWSPFDAPPRSEFHERVGALAAGLARGGIKPGEFLLIHLDNCVEAMLAWFVGVELGAIAVTTDTTEAFFVIANEAKQSRNEQGGLLRRLLLAMTAVQQNIMGKLATC